MTGESLRCYNGNHFDCPYPKQCLCYCHRGPGVWSLVGLLVLSIGAAMMVAFAFAAVLFVLERWY